MKTLTEALALIGLTALMFIAVGLYHDVQIVTPEDIEEICQSYPSDPTEEQIISYLKDQEGFYYPLDEVVEDDLSDDLISVSSTI